MSLTLKNTQSLEQAVTQIVKNNFTAVDISSLLGYNIESFTKNGQMSSAGGVAVVEMSESIQSGGRRLFLLSTSRWGGSHVVS